MNNDSANKIRVIVDTNLWISFLIGQQVGKLMTLLASPMIETITTQLLIDELFEVAHRPKFAKYFNSDDVEILSAWLNTTTSIEIGDITPRCRDPKDDYLLQLAIDAKAIYLVSGDKDLLELGHIEGCRIMTVKQFEAELSLLLPLNA